MEWVHCHIARKPAPPAERLESVPAPDLGDRHETARQDTRGSLPDRRRCRARSSTLSCRMGSNGRIDDFRSAEGHARPAADPRKTVRTRARDRDVAFLLRSRRQDAVLPELLLVSGYSGVGKSSVVNELQKVLVPPRGLFASGKFDQYKRDIPYATLAQAFQSLVRPLLSKSEAELQGWRNALREALGPNGLLIADLVPELKLIIGEQPPVPDLSPQDAQGSLPAGVPAISSAFSHGRNIRWRCSSMICNGLTWQRSICSRIC